MAAKTRPRTSVKAVNQKFGRPWWTIETVNPDSHVVRINDVGHGWERWVMLSSDRHHDNIHARHDLERQHLDLARERDALIIDAGDIFCAMQGRGDPRGSYDALRPENRTDRYLDSLVETATQFYAPYARNFALLGKGNHETKVLKHYNTDLVDRLASGLRGHGGATMAGVYAGWVSLNFHIHRTVRRKLAIRYFHGSGGGGPVTRGTIQSNRMAVNWPDAHIVFSGHTHDGWIMAVPRQRITSNGVPFDDVVWHIRTPTYKDEHSGGMGYQVERGNNPKPLGCWWLKLEFRSKSDIEVTPIPQIGPAGSSITALDPIRPEEGPAQRPEWESGIDGEGSEGDG